MTSRRRRRRDEEDWRARRGRFAGLDPDAPDRPQVMPAEEPPPERQTHNRIADLHGPAGDDDPGRGGGDHGGA
jgi:hypothetical protein